MTKMLRGLMLPREAGIALSTAISQILQSDPHQETSSETLRLERFLRSLTSIYASLGRDNPYDALLGHRFSRETYLFGSGGPWISNIVSSDIPLNVKLSLMAKPCAYILRSRRSKGNLPLQEAIFLGILEPQPGTLLLPQDLWNALQEISGSLYFPEVSQQMLVKLYRKAFESGSASSVKRDGKFVVERTSAPRDFMRELAIQFAFHEKDEVREWTVEANLKALLFIGKDLQTSRMASHYCSGYMIDAWDFTVSRCVDIVGTDGTITVPPDLSESLSKDAVSILSDSQLRKSRKLLKAVWKLNHEFEFLTYQELFRDFENLPHDAAHVWTLVLRENREPAYTWFIKLDILSHLSSQYRKRDCQLWDVLPAFVEGISRLSSSHSDECHKYLFQSEHLFTACVGLCYASRDYARCWGSRWDLVRSLIGLDPRHPSWAERMDYLHRYVDAESPLAPESMHDDIQDVFRFINKCLETHQGTQGQTQLAAAEPTTMTPSKELPSGDQSSGQLQRHLGFLHRVWSHLFGNGIKTPQSDAEQGESE
ncbi:hypothetical protein BDN71DRAFT_1546665 [Pleurotus eryngii]|uniref:Uncharacterized protein n=1 Tax=Pleurotus eryngii TaxID=5323 RepID=A0A9P6D1D7_PLEER|nr:hypothetical protein BDN71DRAFT_1546665 [Pleurotus eryngii]